MGSHVVTRRRFLSDAKQATIGIGTGLTLLANSQSVRSAQANDKISLALIGVRGRGNHLAAGFLERDDCEITHVCDVNETTGTIRAATYAEAQGGKQVKFVQDYRDLVREESIDAVVIATPDHWHGPLTVFS